MEKETITVEEVKLGRSKFTVRRIFIDDRQAQIKALTYLRDKVKDNAIKYIELPLDK